MKTKLKRIMYSLSIASFISISPSMASDLTAVMEPVIAPTQPVPAPVSMEPVVSNAAILGIDDKNMQLITSLMAMLSNVNIEAKRIKAEGGNPDIQQIIENVFSEKGLANQGVDVLSTLTEIINGYVQKSENPKCDGCKTGCASFTSGLSSSSKKMKKILPLVDKYYRFFDDAVNKDHLNGLEITQRLIKYGLMEDLNKILEVTQVHHANMRVAMARKEEKQVRMQAKARAKVNRKKA